MEACPWFWPSWENALKMDSLLKWWTIVRFPERPQPIWWRPAQELQVQELRNHQYSWLDIVLQSVHSHHRYLLFITSVSYRPSRLSEFHHHQPQVILPNFNWTIYVRSQVSPAQRKWRRCMTIESFTEPLLMVVNKLKLSLKLCSLPC